MPTAARRCARCGQHLDAAQESIDICTFILGRGPVGRRVIDTLCAKARAGVRVRLLLDGMGSLMAGRPDLKPLQGGRRIGGAVRAAAAFAAEGAHQPAQPPQAADRRRRARVAPAVVRRAQPGLRILRGHTRPSAVARPELRPDGPAGAAGRGAVRARLGLRQHRARAAGDAARGQPASTTAARRAARSWWPPAPTRWTTRCMRCCSAPPTRRGATSRW